MPIIPSLLHLDHLSQWSFKITDQENGGKNKDNPLKLNLQKAHKTCQHLGCANSIRSTKHSGLCQAHQKHQHDLLFSLINPEGNSVSIPKHTEIVNHLVEWAKTRNYNLTPLFSNLSFLILGNIPDVSTLAGEISHEGYDPPSVQNLFAVAVGAIDKFFPDTNNSSYQPLKTSKGIYIPARILAITFAGLLLCEEANRGDRWFWRQVKKQEYRTTFLGAAMPIAYYAALTFPWGVELGKAAEKLTPAP